MCLTDELLALKGPLTMSHGASIIQVIHDLLWQQQLGVLSTVGKDAPYASLVAYAVSDDDSRLFFVTPRATRKFANISANAHVALLVNNSINHPDDFHQAAAVTAVGCAGTVSPQERGPIITHYLSKHPYLETFAHAPSSELLGIRVERYVLVQQFQNVTEYLVQSDVDHTP